MTDKEIQKQFTQTDDFIRRVLRCGEDTLYAYAVDGLVSGGDMSEYILKPISENLRGGSMQERHSYSDEKVLQALAVAGLFGALVKRNASISGAECGCQAEIGTACSMAAAALCTLKD